ncbi:hypothetical protein [Lacticaseibacillus saniviri]|uniref:hypothetical protein n=1 Tax=Lacticaseibacillus saniviri TaxID=931533 RepID=UPI0006D0CF73|nr:hypothetical protein [Lacticaseibacillus saniviri]
MADVSPDKIASGTPGEGDTRVGLVGLDGNPSTGLFLGWDMFGNLNPIPGQVFVKANQPDDYKGSRALAQLNIFSLDTATKTISAVGNGQNPKDNSIPMDGNFGTGDSRADFLQNTDVNWAFNWTPDKTPAGDGKVHGTLTYSLDYTQAGTEIKGTPSISYSVDLPEAMSIAMHMSTGWAYSTTSVGIDSATFIATSGKLDVNYLNSGTPTAPSDLASTEITGNIGDSYAFDGVDVSPDTADHTFIVPSVPDKIPLYSQDALEHFTKDPQTANVGYISDPTPVQNDLDAAAKEVADRYDELQNKIANAHLTQEQQQSPTFINAKEIADDAASDFKKRLFPDFRPNWIEPKKLPR